MKIKTLLLAVLAVTLLGACVPESVVPPTPKLDISLPVYDSEEVWTAADYQGKPVLIAVMATWCPWCKRSLPALDEASKTYAGQVEVVGVFVDEDPALVANVKKEHNMQTKALYNGREAAETLSVQGFPHVMLFDKNHKLVKVWSGYSDTLAEQYKAEINKLLK